VGVADTVDPLAGRMRIEQRTTDIRKRSYNYKIDKIDAMGGMLLPSKTDTFSANTEALTIFFFFN